MAQTVSNHGRFPPHILLLLCALLFHSLLAIVDGNTGGTWLVADVQSLYQKPVCSPPKETNSKRLPITHRSSPCSPLSADSRPSHAQILKNDQVRVSSIQSRIRDGKRSFSVIVPAKPGLSLDIGNYVVKIGMGTPRNDFYVAVDTGSDLSWINCYPCLSCHGKPSMLYNPTRSRTHTDILCNSTDCTRIDQHYCSVYKRCNYKVIYGDMSQTNGHIVRDTLFLSGFDTLPNFIFGCGNNNTGLFGKVDGLIGLGRDNISLASQASSKYGAIFSYCLPSVTSTNDGYLLFGKSTLSNTKFTPMIKKPSSPSFYYLNLTTILVGSYPLDVSSTVLTRDPGIVIDSGTVITRLPPVAYDKLKTLFQQLMDYQNYKKSPPFEILDTCYNITGLDKVRLPTVSLVFSGGAVLDLDIPGILYTPDRTLTCLAFANTSGGAYDVGIIGNTQQQTFDVSYDIANQMIGFRQGGCS
ncbi:Eukaryotic aspartyl protease family protein [Rhynchospora pubera]|uniref:Eukaryotic aspartyl protease family protein n=1 Tax=Rhynchospora pubera TaxID=906938 RepID=A0AAV8H7C6_9POAL|nr:Eukaryotic aspartyl protease family protein [Rhynchospora pubera]